MSDSERRLITSASFRQMVRRGAKPQDLSGIAVFKAARGNAKALAGPDRAIEFVLSNVHEDREGDSIEVKGWRTEQYTKNPVVLFAHMQSDLPIARASRVWVENEDLKAVDIFAGPDLYPFADTVYRMVREKFLNAVSVGFQPDEWEEMPSRTGGIHFLEQELLEHSVVPVPAHPEALVVARSKGIDTLPLKAWAEQTLDMLRAKDVEGPIRRQVERLRAQADPNGRKLTLALGMTKLPAGIAGPELLRAVDRAAAAEAPQQQLKAVPKNVSTELADEGEAWSAPNLGDFTSKAWADLTDAEKTHIAGHYAHATELPPATFGDLHLPHHRASDGKAVFRGVAAAAGRLAQSSIPAGDVAAVKAHLRAHYQAFGSEVPDSLKDASPETKTPQPDTMDCPDCGGTGTMPDGSVCPTCDGTGTKSQGNCTYCGGKGSMPDGSICTKCNGTGMMPDDKPAASDAAAAALLGLASAPAVTRSGPDVSVAVQAARDTKAIVSAVVGEMRKAVAVPVTLGLPDMAQPARWNKRWSKVFDVQREPFPPRSAEQALVARYVGCEMKDLYLMQYRVGGARMGSFLSAVDEVMREPTIVDTVRNISDGGYEEPPVHAVIELNSAQSKDFMVDGCRYFRYEGRPLAMRIAPTWSGLEATIYCDAKLSAKALELKDTIAQRQKQLNFLKGEAFALCGDFLPRDGAVSWDDLFLSEANEASSKRIAQLINEKGAAMDNRGVLLVGPPGTGKTLFGRVLLNETRATYIWLSARDFYYSGGFYGLMEAFELARECAPTVLFIEDVDNYLRGDTVDLMKTEMDGLAQSFGVVTILTTNFPELIPQALIDRPGRFHDVLRFDLPDDEVRTRMVGKWMPGLTDEETARAVQSTAGFSGAHVRELARFAGIIAEQEKMSLGSALEAAIAKLKEQRDLITSVQATGSRYRSALLPPSGPVAARVKATFSGTVAVTRSTVVDKAQEVRAKLVEAVGHGQRAWDELGDTEEGDLKSVVELLTQSLDAIDEGSGGAAPAAAAPVTAAEPKPIVAGGKQHLFLTSEEEQRYREVGTVDEAKVNALVDEIVGRVVMRRTGVVQ